MPSGLGGDLVDRDAELDVGAGGLAGAAAGEEGGDAAGVVAGAVAAVRGVLLLEAGEDLEVLAVGFHRLEGVAQLVARGGAVGPPVFEVHAVRDVEEGHPQRRAAGGGGERAAAGCRRPSAGGRLQRGQARRLRGREEAAAAGEGGVGGSCGYNVRIG